MLGLECEAHVSCSCWDDLQVGSGILSKSASIKNDRIRHEGTQTHAFSGTRLHAPSDCERVVSCHLSQQTSSGTHHHAEHSSLNTISQSFQQIKSSLDDSWLTNSSGVKTKERGREITQTSGNEGTSGTKRQNVMLPLMIIGRFLITIISRGP